MKYQLLLLWTLAAFVSCDPGVNEITPVDMPDGIKLSCGSDNVISKNGTGLKYVELQYKDENTGEYKCEGTDSKIFVKFRTCDNCIELDTASIAGIVVGDVVATVAVGVAVYLIASKGQPSTDNTAKKRSDRQPLVPNEGPTRTGNDHYQPLRPRQGLGRDEYDVLKK
ncbi:T-cell surface glycoprotein CD3 gamma chain-like [Melanotaenia boesemani]|uniref:T-cell surface glycoprotein CD3 gamma chain-like n=1 Tax=Melanotaenia boesemani TaxID=1250792 RepID=UPI001C03F0FA|nr:T-cell surface glycoprotein CD3 gamma chain-like [Melanotaenia boesemani]